MDKIKARISRLKEEIDVCEQRETDAKGRLNEATARLEAAETEKNSFLRRLKMLQVELTKTNGRLQERQERLDCLESKTAEHETAVKNLEDQEVEGDERLGTLSEQIKRGQDEVDTYDTQWREAKRKEVVLMKELEKAESRIDDSNARIDQLMKAITNSTDLIKDLEARESDQCERETLTEEKLAFLGCQQKEVLSRAEAAERDAARLDRIITGLKGDIKNWKNKTADVLAEIEDVNNMAEDME